MTYNPNYSNTPILLSALRDAALSNDIKLTEALNHSVDGIPAGSIPLVTPENYLWLNYRAIHRLNLPVNQGLLGMADKIIK